MNENKKMKEVSEEQDQVREIPAADISVTVDETSVVTSERSFPVKIPSKDANDFVLEIHASDIRRIRNRLSRYRNVRFSWCELK